MTGLLPDDVLRACAYLEAVWTENADDQTAILQHAPGEAPTAVLVAELGNSILQQLLPPQFGIHDGLPPQDLQLARERMQADPAVRVSKLLVETLKAIAPTADPAQAEASARAIISYLLTVTDAGPDDVLPLLAHLRRTTIQRIGDTAS